MKDKILTVKQALKQEADGNIKLLNELMYSSYAVNRDHGVSHKMLVRIGIGNDDMFTRYNKSKN